MFGIVVGVGVGAGEDEIQFERRTQHFVFHAINVPERAQGGRILR